jgi:outer membrane protein OmpA-like peptidoglycan-associated protein
MATTSKPSKDFEDGMTSKSSRKAPLLAMAAISTTTLAIFCGSANAELVAGWRVAQDAQTPPNESPPNLTPEQKLKIEEWKKKRHQQQPDTQPGAEPPPANSAPPPPKPPDTAVKPRPPKPPEATVQPPPPVAPPAVVPPAVPPKVVTPPPPAATPPVAPVTKPQPAPVVRPETPPAAPPVKIVNPPQPPKPAEPVVPPAKVVTPPPPAKTEVPSAPPAKVVAPPTPSKPVESTPPPAKVVTPPPAKSTDVVTPPAAGAPPPKVGTAPPPNPLSGAPAKPYVPVVRNLEQAKTGRVEKVEAGDRTVIKEADKRVIVRQGDKVVIQKDEAAQMQRVAPDAVVTRGKLGARTAVVERPNNEQIVSETDRSGQLIRRFRRDANGNESDIIDNRQHKKNRFGRNLAIGIGVGAGIIAGAAILNSVVDVPPPVVRVPRDKYVVRYEDANEEDVYEALNAPPVEESERRYTLNQVRATPHLRDRMRRIDLDDINFETGSWEVDPSEYSKLERVARAMKRVIRRNSNEVFLIEGYTDAVGSDVDNLTLSDRRAESVSVILTEQFEVPFENLTTQGYGEQYLKVEVDGPERTNRRVAVRRVTPLLAHQNERVEAAPPPPPPRVEERNYEEEQRDRWRRRHWRRHQHHYNRDY